jgi:hypothetical protein
LADVFKYLVPVCRKFHDWALVDVETFPGA